MNIPYFPGSKRLLDLYYAGYSYNAIANDAILQKNMLLNIENERSRSWAVYHRVKSLIDTGVIVDRRKGKVAKDKEIMVIISDAHAPYHSEESVDVARQIILDIQPDVLFLDGDMLDFYQISRFDNKPGRKLDLQQDLDVGKDLIFSFREAAPDARMIFKLGNHEARLEKWKSKNAEVGMLRCLEFDNLLGLNDIDCELLLDYEPFIWNDWCITHGALSRNRGGYTAHGMIDRYGMNGVSGHIHRLAMVKKKNMSRSFTWCESGCLCKLKMEYGEVFDWQNGFVVLTHQDGTVYPELVGIDDGQAMYHGKKYRAR